MTQQFNLGDIVTKQYGKKPAEVTYAPRYSGGQFTCRYLYITGLEDGSKNGNVTIYVPTEGGLPVPTLSYDRK